ncbi:type II toxin-antitoxin system RelE family toxin [Aeromonas media]|uniref:type II toxin-antitoxin system RelE family toxin n=1 Tax=Aeromonas media TaxID=651 RepID=UPI003CFC54AE
MFDIEFDDRALPEWRSLDRAVREQLQKKLAKLVEQPHVPKNALHGNLAGCYKVKLLKAGVRLVYKVEDEQLVILIVAVGKRDKHTVYKAASARLD